MNIDVFINELLRNIGMCKAHAQKHGKIDMAVVSEA